MEKVIKDFNVMREDLKGLSDETVALLLVAKKLDVIANKPSILDPDQLTLLTGRMEEIAISLHGVGEMVEKSQQ